MERYEVKDHYHAWYEHWHRYHWVSPLLSQKVVADMACGEGYGSALISHSAQQVFGVDIDSKTIESAQSKYNNISNLNYINADVLSTPIEESSIDVVVSFETLEHLVAHDLLMHEFKRVLHDSGTLVLSTPDKSVYSGNDNHNEFHLKELHEDEFRDLVETNFKHVIYFGQQFQTASMLAPLKPHLNATQATTHFLQQGHESSAVNNLNKPTYLIAVASDSKQSIAAFESLGTNYMNDDQNSLYKHYEKQVKQFMQVDAKLIETEKQIEIQNQIINQLKARLGL